MNDPFELVWEASPQLAMIRRYAHIKGTPSHAVLACVLVRVALELRPHVKLPGTIASPAALNLGACLVSNSGGGKSATLDVSGEVLNITAGGQRVWQSGNTLPGGTGEGIAQAYLQAQTDEDGKTVRGPQVLIEDPRWLFTFDEAETFGALHSRTGSTLRATLKTAVTGGMLGNTNGSVDTSRRVPSGAYRFTAICNVQPLHSSVFFEDELGGTPQRFLWVRADDPWIPPLDEYFDPVTWEPLQEAEPIYWTPPTKFVADKFIDYSAEIKGEIIRANHEKARGQGDPLAAHKNLTRLKVAALLAALHGEVTFDQKWWGIAGVIVDESQNIQRECKRALDAEKVRTARMKGQLSDAADAAKTRSKRHRAGIQILEYLEANGAASRSALEGIALEVGVSVRTFERIISDDLRESIQNEGREGFQGEVIYRLTHPPLRVTA